MAMAMSPLLAGGHMPDVLLLPVVDDTCMFSRRPGEKSRERPHTACCPKVNSFEEPQLPLGIVGRVLYCIMSVGTYVTPFFFWGAPCHPPGVVYFFCISHEPLFFYLMRG